MARQLLIALLLACFVGGVVAGGPRAVRKQVVSTMVVKGTIDLDAAGRVVGHALDKQATLPPGVVGLVASAAPQWRFEPVEEGGKARAVRAQMTLRLVAKETEAGDFLVRIAGASFGQVLPGEQPTSARLAPPRYPGAAARSGVGGTVYVVLKIARDGNVEEAIAEQVNLRIVDSEQGMVRWRGLFADAALQAARRWTFHPPTAGAELAAPFWSVRVPVDFIAPGRAITSEHEWHAYVPGPRQVVPWYPESSPSPAADALAADGVYPLRSSPRLLTSLDPT